MRLAPEVYRHSFSRYATWTDKQGATRATLHTVDYRERGPKQGAFYNKGHFLTVRPVGEEKAFAGGIQVVLRKPKREFSLRFHVGTASSETPFDGHVTFFGTGIYWQIESGRRLAAWLTHEERHPFAGRDIELGFAYRHLRWKVWTHPEPQGEGEFAGWREGRVMVGRKGGAS